MDSVLEWDFTRVERRKRRESGNEGLPAIRNGSIVVFRGASRAACKLLESRVLCGGTPKK